MALPTIYRIYKIFTIFWNHVIVIFVFFFYLVVLFAVRRSFLNTGSLMIILILLGTYLNNGLKSLLKFWNIIAIYQACVLLMLLSVQFIIYTQENSSIEYFRLDKIWINFSEYDKALFHYAGFYKNENQKQWLELVPYVIMYFFAIIA